MMKKLFKPFFVFFALPVILAFLAYLPNGLFFYNSGELEKGAVIGKKLAMNDDCVFSRGSRLGAEAEVFKFSQYEILKPKVVAFGSSRAMQYRQDYLNVPFFTFGGAVDNVFQLHDAVKKATAINKPEFALLGLDYWWFNKHYQTGILPKQKNLYKVVRNNFRQAFLSYTWLASEKLTVDEYIPVLKTPYAFRETCRMGVRASLEQRGFTHDGSYFYGLEYIEENEEVGFDKEIKNVEQQTFRNGGKPDSFTAARLESLKDTIAFLDDQDINYIVVFPPLAPQIYDYLKRTRPDMHAFMEKVVSEVKTVSPYVYDFHNPADLQSGNCEFLDGDHGGQIAYTRIMKAIRNSAIKPYLDMKQIDQDIRENKGRTVAPRILQKYMGEETKEIDFLKMGCKK